MKLELALVGILISIPLLGTWAADKTMNSVECKTAAVKGLNISYREAGPKDAPVIILLHGFPSSSTMLATLLPLLVDKYHVIAPDYPGFGRSDAPPADKFAYTFDRIAGYMDKFIPQLKLAPYALYLQDYGGPVGFRLALAHDHRLLFIGPEVVSARVEIFIKVVNDWVTRWYLEPGYLIIGDVGKVLDQAAQGVAVAGNQDAPAGLNFGSDALTPIGKHTRARVLKTFAVRYGDIGIASVAAEIPFAARLRRWRRRVKATPPDLHLLIPVLSRHIGVIKSGESAVMTFV